MPGAIIHAGDKGLCFLTSCVCWRVLQSGVCLAASGCVAGLSTLETLTDIITFSTSTQAQSREVLAQFSTGGELFCGAGKEMGIGKVSGREGVGTLGLARLWDMSCLVCHYRRVS